MRDSMILFQDYYDSNELFNFLIEHAVFIGGELGNPDCWFVPPEFISNYWFLCPSYRPMRLDNSVEIAVGFAQKMVTSTLKKRKEMYIQRDQYQDAFPQPTLSEEMEEDVKQDYTLDTLVLHHINRDVPKIISTV
ncbi:hypothetical protein G6F56_009847 [Rhizopus delemar]|nr:hypothetical protein G6F56_009847 [Rhizopus delemar]